MGRRLATMTNDKYKPEPRLIDDPKKLRELYQKDDLTVREIAKEHASVSRTSVWNALHEHGICGGDDEGRDANSEMPDSTTWEQLTD